MSTIRREISLTEFDTWGGATDTVNYLTNQELESLEDLINELFHGEGTALNDFLWFETEMIAQHLGYDSFDEIIER